MRQAQRQRQTRRRIAVGVVMAGVVVLLALLTGALNGGKSKAKYTIDDGARKEARARVEAVLSGYPVYPELDLAMIELVERMPSRYKISPLGERKWLYRRGAASHLPPAVARRLCSGDVDAA